MKFCLKTSLFPADRGTDGTTKLVVAVGIFEKAIMSQGITVGPYVGSRTADPVAPQLCSVTYAPAMT